MSKSVLVIDTPKKCMHCPLLNDADECTVQDDAANFKAGNSWDELMKGCPLKPLPEKKEYVDPTSSEKAKKNIIAVGWNTCINMIVKGDSDD